MKVISQQESESVLCVMANGDSIEVTMLEVEGEEFLFVNNAEEAANLLSQHINLQEILVNLATKTAS